MNSISSSAAFENRGTPADSFAFLRAHWSSPHRRKHRGLRPPPPKSAARCLD